MYGRLSAIWLNIVDAGRLAPRLMGFEPDSPRECAELAVKPWRCPAAKLESEI